MRCKRAAQTVTKDFQWEFNFIVAAVFPQISFTLLEQSCLQDLIGLLHRVDYIFYDNIRLAVTIF